MSVLESDLFGPSGKLGWTLMLNAIIAITFTFSFLAPLLIIAMAKACKVARIAN